MKRYGILKRGLEKKKRRTAEGMPSAGGLGSGGEGDPGTSLRKFYGTLAAIHRDRNEKLNYYSLVLEFTDVQVLKATGIYPFTAATISIKESREDNSSWRVFADSLIDCIPENEDLINQVNKRFGLEYTFEHDSAFPHKHTEPTDKKGNKPDVVTGAWRVFEAITQS